MQGGYGEDGIGCSESIGWGVYTGPPKAPNGLQKDRNQWLIRLD